MSVPTTTASPSAPSPFSVSYIPKQGPPQRLRFEPRDDNEGWWLIELRYVEDSWRTVGREPLTDVQFEAQLSAELLNGRNGSSSPSHPLDLFLIVAQERAWQVLLTVSLLDEPVSRTQLRQFVTAYDHGDVTTEHPIDSNLIETLDDIIGEMVTVDVIEETPNGITSGPQFGQAFEAVLIG